MEIVMPKRKVCVGFKIVQKENLTNKLFVPISRNVKIQENENKLRGKVIENVLREKLPFHKACQNKNLP